MMRNSGRNGDTTVRDKKVGQLNDKRFGPDYYSRRFKPRCKDTKPQHELDWPLRGAPSHAIFPNERRDPLATQSRGIQPPAPKIIVWRRLDLCLLILNHSHLSVPGKFAGQLWMQVIFSSES